MRKRDGEQFIEMHIFLPRQEMHNHRLCARCLSDHVDRSVSEFHETDSGSSMDPRIC